MPTLLTVGPYRFFCYAGDRDEPPHVHVQNNKGFSRMEINRIQKLVEEHQEQLLEGWNDFFND